MKFCFQLICVLTVSLMATHALSQDLSGWSDKTVCRLVESDGDAAYVEEANSRGLECKAPIKVTKSKSSKPKPSKSKSDITKFSGHNFELPDNLAWQPNDVTIAYYYNKNDTLRLRLQEAYKVDPSNNPVEFIKKIEQHKVIDREMATKTAFSYLYYEDGLVIYDAMPPDGRFSMVLDNSSYFSSHSMGKSITSYLIGHAVCEGYISSIDAPISDWPLMENTLYYGQPLIRLLNMTAGDGNVIKRGEGTFIKTKRNIHGNAPLRTAVKNPLELANTKPISAAKYSYSNLTADVLFNYMMHRVGLDFDTFIANFYQRKVRIKHPIYIEMNPLDNRIYPPPIDERIKQGAGRYGVSATRYDYLRIAKAMMDDWQNDTCEGRYLKEIYNRRVPRNRRISSWNSADLKWGNPHFGHTAKTYGGQFWTDIVGLLGRNVLVMNGANGQNIAMDMDNSRIVVISAGKSKHVNMKKLAYEPLKYGRIR
jgi:hypothetical protein